jgi:hypothetical protein
MPEVLTMALVTISDACKQVVDTVSQRTVQLHNMAPALTHPLTMLGQTC